MFDKDKSDALLRMDKTDKVVDALIRMHSGLIGKQLKKFHLVGDPDAISLAYEALYNAIMTYNGSSQFSTYATVCIYNRLGGYVRSLKTQIVQNTISYDNLTYLDNLPSPDTADGNTLEEDAIGTIMLAAGKCIQECTNTTHKKVLRLWMESDFMLTQNEIAEQLGISQTYVSRIINKFRKSLKSKLEVE